MEAIKQQIEQGFADLKSANEKRDEEIKRFGEVTQETKSQMEALNENLTNLKKQMDEMAAKNNRAFTPDGAKSEEQKAADEAFYKFLRKGRGDMAPEERKALVADADGQVIIPEELDREILRALPEMTIFRDLVNVRSTSSDRIRKRAMGEVTVGWGKIETSTKTLADFESDLTPSDQYIFIENLNGLIKIGLDELEDTDIQLQQYLVSSFGQAAAEAEDTAVLKGRGHNFEEPEGILVASGVGRVDTAAVGAVTADDLIALMYQLNAAYRKNGSFVIPSHLEAAIRTLKTASGDYIWQPALTAGTPNVLLGRPVFNQDDFAPLAAGADQAVFGDFKRGYTLADRAGSTIQRLNELYIEDDLVGFKFKKRVGGGVDRKDAFKVLRVKA